MIAIALPPLRRYLLAPAGLAALAALGGPGATPASAQTLPRCDFAGRSIPLALGQKRDGVIGGPKCRGKEDTFWTPQGFTGHVYRITLPATTAVEISATSDQFPPEIDLVDANGVGLTYDDSDWLFERFHGRTTTVTIPVTLRAGTYYLLVDQGSVRRDRSAGTRYQLRLRDAGVRVAADAGGMCEEDEDAVRDAARRPPLSPRGEAREMQLGIADCFAYGEYRHHFRLSVPTRRTLAIRAESQTEDLEPEVRVLDAAGVGLFDREDADDSDAAVRAELAAGEYLVEIGHDGGGRWTAGKYRLHVEPIGTPTADSSKVGAVCASRPDPVDVRRDTVWLRGVFTRASCTRSTGEAYHRYSFTTTRPQRLTLWEGEGRPIAFDLAGPAGPVKQEGTAWHGKDFDQVVPAGRYVLTVSSRRTKETTPSPTGRFEARLVVRDPQVGEDGRNCTRASYQPLEVGETVTGRLSPTTCTFRAGQLVAPAELYGFNLAEPAEVVVELEPGEAMPILFVSSPTGGKAGQPMEGPGTRTARVSLPAGDHTVIVIAGKESKPGTFRLTVK